MVKLLIIDDEPEIIEGIKCSIEWEENDIVVIGEASNGVEALEVINKVFPDIILVDIRMPLMNGLQLIEALSSTHPYIKSIIISGYDDFVYTQKALKLGASDYLLKPCEPSEILNSVLTAKKAIENARRQESLQRNSVIDYYVSNQFIKNKYLSSLLNEKNTYDTALIDKFNIINLSISHNNFRLMAMRIDSYIDFIKRTTIQDIDLIKYAIINITDEILRSKYNCEVFENNDDIIVILNISKNDNIDSKLIDKIKTEISIHLNQTVSLGISNYCYDISELHALYKQALTAVEYRFFLGKNSVTYFCNVENKYSSGKHYPLDLEKQIITSIKAGDFEEVKKHFNSFYKSVIEKDSNKQHILKTCLSLLYSIYHLAIDNKVDGNEIMEKIILFGQMDKFTTFEDLKTNTYEIISLVFDEINNNKVDNRIIRNAISYIHEHYSEDIDLESVAKNIYISPSYVSTLFKHVLGQNFVDYLHKYRLGKACELLKNSQLKAYEVAYMVGYNDDKYFCQIFKKHLGLTPSKYRENII